MPSYYQRKLLYMQFMSFAKRMFGNVVFHDFIRVIIFDDYFRVQCIKSSRTILNRCLSFRDKSELLDYLKSNSSMPIEIIISNSSMNYRSIYANKLKESDIRVLSENTLKDYENVVNAVLYEHKSSYKDGNVLICSMKLNQIVSIMIKDIINSRNPIIALNCLPMWFADKYFDKYKGDIGNFNISIFSVEFDAHVELMAFAKSGLLKSSYILKSSNDIEKISQKFIGDVAKATKVHLEDIAIYQLKYSSIDEFTSSSKTNMKIISKNNDIYVPRINVNLNRVIKIASVSALFAVIVNTSLDVIKIFDLNEKIFDAKNIISSVDQNLIDEISYWQNIDIDDTASHIDFKSLLEKQMQNRTKKLKNAVIDLSEHNAPKVSVTEDDE